MINGKLKNQQGGWTVLGLLTFLLVAGSFVFVGFKLAPAYSDHETLKSVMRGMQLDEGLLSRSNREIRLHAIKTMRVNNMQLPEDYLKITRDKGDVILDVNYEVRIPMFYNIEALVVFKEQYIGKEGD